MPIILQATKNEDKTINSTQFDVVITRHRDLVALYLEKGFVTADIPCIDHTDNIEDVRNKRVLGVVPAKLAIYANSVTEVKLSIPKERRGIELPLEELQKYAGEASTYKVEQIETRTDFSEAVLATPSNTFIQYVVRHDIIERRGKAHMEAARRDGAIKKEDILGRPVVGHLPYWIGMWALDVTSLALMYKYNRRGLVHSHEEMSALSPELFTYRVTRL